MDQTQDFTDYAQQAEALKRRQALLAAMGKQGMEAPIVGNTGLGQALAKIGTAYFSKKGEERSASALQENSRASQSDLAAQLKSYMQQQSGTPATPDQPMGPPTEEGQFSVQPGTPAVAADPKAAVFAAMSSQHPEMKAIGAAGFKEMMPQVKEINGQLVGYSMDKAPKVLGDYRSPQAVNNQLVAPGTMGDFRDKFGNVGPVAQGPTGPIYGQSNTGTGEVKFAPGGTNVSVNTQGEKAAVVAGGQAVPKVLEGARDTVIKMGSQIQSANRILELVKDPQVITGFGAGALGGMAAVAAQLGITGQDAVAKTQALTGELAKQTLANVHLLPGAITEKERPFLEMAAAGKIDWSTDALAHLAGLSLATSHNAIIDARRQYESTVQNFPGAREVSAMYPLPPLAHTLGGRPEDFPNTDGAKVSYTGTFGGGVAKPLPGGAATNAISLDEYLKRMQKGAQ